jgi:hypothetical protein
LVEISVINAAYAGCLHSGVAEALEGFSTSVIASLMTDDERASNEERKQELLQLVSSAQALLLVGAGSSTRLGYPT